jgi:DNA polymerase-4
LRGKPVAVAAYVQDYGCILAASCEAKKLGVKTGMRVREGKMLAPGLTVLPSDPFKYRAVNRQMLRILQSYTAHIRVESIDEMVMNLVNTPAIGRMNMDDIAQEIKRRIKQEIGEWISVSCGIAPNRYLAKVASGLQKPDGLVNITKENIVETFSRMTLTDFCGIKEGNAGRLRSAGIMTPLMFYRASAIELKRAFHSITGHHWWLRLHGYEDGNMYKEFDKDVEEDQKSFGQSYVLGTTCATDDPRLWQILTQLVMKMGKRLRADGFTAYGVGISTMFLDHTHWHTQEKKTYALYSDLDFYTAMRIMLTHAPERQVKLLAVYCYALHRNLGEQDSLFPEENRAKDVTRALDAIRNKFGDFVIYPARMVKMEQKVLDRISFGGVQGLPDVPFHQHVQYEDFSS